MPRSRVAFAASTETYGSGDRSYGLPCDHPWIALQEEVRRRIKQREPLNESQLAANELLSRVTRIGARSVQDGDATSCVACGGTAETILELGRLGRDAVRLCRDCMGALDGTLVTHFGNGRRSRGRY